MIIKIQGKDSKGNPKEFEAGFKWNNHCFESIGGMMHNLTTFSAYILAQVYCGYKGWCLVKNKEEELTAEDFSDWIDESTSNSERLAQVKSITDECAASPRYKEAQKKNDLQSETN